MVKIGPTFKKRTRKKINNWPITVSICSIFADNYWAPAHMLGTGHTDLNKNEIKYSFAALFHPYRQ